MHIELRPMTLDMYQSFFMEYDNDIDLYLDKGNYSHYVYSKELVQQYVQKQLKLHRKTLAILCDDEIVGEIIIKNIKEQVCATMSIVLKNAKYKDQGIGTKAELIAIDYVFNNLNIPTLYADSVVTNTRSQHVLEKVGFKLINEDKEYKYYRIDRE